MSIVTSLVMTSAGLRDFLSETQWSKRVRLSRFANQINALAGGVGGGLAQRTSVRAGTAQATGVITPAAVQSGDTVTVNGQALTATQQNARSTATAASVQVGDTVTVNGQVFTAAAAENLVTGAFNQSGSNTVCAASLAACINANIALRGVVTAANAAAVCTVRAVTGGTAGNALTFVSSNNTRLAVTGSGLLAGGAAVAANQFDFGGTDAQTATALAAALNASTTAIVANHISAAAAAGVVTLTADWKGTSGNAITLASSNGTRLPLTGITNGRLIGGTDATFDF